MYAIQIYGCTKLYYITGLDKITNIVTATNLRLVELDGYFNEVINPNADNNDQANNRKNYRKIILNQWLIVSVNPV